MEDEKIFVTEFTDNKTAEIMLINAKYPDYLTKYLRNVKYLYFYASFEILFSIININIMYASIYVISCVSQGKNKNKSNLCRCVSS